ncbi:lipid A deacylase LpxR family protein [Photobacterium atrarenae]|uniref:Lipid A deacylase LpxR family protein n=1 Tax=Photobacterium atrarenae TaxID=865757 RepID=A0ABY5GLW3_9GAMM|nr:lipid A deacylase LpxR family protein [Photobacterium atrarenae]UTV30090.1 lipid A deacylase LpxR family protein [Photobacterium atrarenae]
MLRVVFITHMLLLSPVTFAGNSGSVSVTLDNDGILGADKNYTHGFFASYHTPASSAFQQRLPSALAYGADALLSNRLLFDDQSLKGWSARLGYQIWTPATLSSDVPLAGERPYAGLLFVEAALYQFSMTRSDTLQVMVGTLGPHALAKEGQSVTHNLIGSEQPQGWDYQIDNQPVFTLSYQSNRRFLHGQLNHSQTRHHLEDQTSDRRLSIVRYDLSYTGRVSIGNYQTEVAAGLIARLGTDLNSPSGSITFESGHGFNPGMRVSHSPDQFLFMGLEGRRQFTDLTIEGTRHSHQVPIPPTTLEPWQASLQFGGAYLLPDWGAVASLTLNTPDFQQDSQNGYAWGSLMVFLHW